MRFSNASVGYRVQGNPELRPESSSSTQLNRGVNGKHNVAVAVLDGVHLAAVTTVPAISAFIMDRPDADAFADWYDYDTELEREMQNRLRTESELREAQKLEAIGQLASGIAHEINTPIQFIGDSVEFVREAFEDMFALVDDYRAELRAIAAGENQPDLQSLAQREDQLDLEFIREELPQSVARTASGVERVAEIVRGMKGFAHQDFNEMQATDLNATIRDTLIVARNEYKYVADVETAIGELPPVECFAGQMSQVLLNLVVNAAHAIADNTPSGQRGKIIVTSRCLGELVEIQVRDTGGGIPEDVRPRIFEPFFTTKEVGKGTGQGLAIVHRIITERHAGAVKVEVEDGVGTTFKIQIPAVKTMECAA